MSNYSYARCLENAYKVNWRIEDVLAERRFDPEKRWLPLPLSGARHVSCLDAAEKRALTQVEMAAYAHLFGYVEEFIAPKVSELAKDYAIDQRGAFDALTNFAAEEVKHMNLFRRLRERVAEALGFQPELLGGEAETARFVLSKSTGSVLLLTAAIEWFTQLHYLDAFRDDAQLDPFTKHVFLAHWQEESQHAQLDHLETLRVFDAYTPAERDRAIDELIELVAAVDGLLQTQARSDVRNLTKLTNRGFTPVEQEDLFRGILSAKRWTFIESGVTHPRFQELFEAVSTPAQRERVSAALGQLLASTTTVMA